MLGRLHQHPAGLHIATFRNRTVVTLVRGLPCAGDQAQIGGSLLGTGESRDITQRRQNGLLGGLWEFPGGKIAAGETPEGACIRELEEEVNLKVSVRHFLKRVKHAYTHFKITADVFVCDYVSGRVKLNGPVDHCWIAVEDIERYPFPKANLKFIPKLREVLKSSDG